MLAVSSSPRIGRETLHRAKQLRAPITPSGSPLSALEILTELQKTSADPLADIQAVLTQRAQAAAAAGDASNSRT